MSSSVVSQQPAPVIEIGVARTGVAVLKRDGRFLASSVDPVREASSWADRLSAGLSRNETLIVLGLGSGYHVSALLERSLSVLVIEREKLIVEQALTILPALSQMRVLTNLDASQLIANEIFGETVCGAYRIAAHGPSLQIDPAYYSRVEALLQARDPLSFLMMLKTRPELLAQLDPRAVGTVALDAESPHAVSIKTLAKLFGPQSSGSRERRLWRILEELVV